MSLTTAPPAGLDADDAENLEDVRLRCLVYFRLFFGGFPTNTT